VGTNLYSASGAINNNSNQFGIKIDDYATQNDNLNFRYSFYQSADVNPLSPQGASVPGFPVGEDQRAQNFVAQETHAFTPTLVGVLRFSFLRNKFLYGQSEVHTSPESLGFQYSPSLAVAEGPPFIQISGYTDIGNPITGPRNTYENLYNISGSMSWSRGKHLFKFGGGYERQQINVTQGIATNGFFVFAPFPVTDAFASFLSGTPVVFLQGLGNFTRHIRGNEFNAHAQDTYKLTPRITLNLGLRYELPMPNTELNYPRRCSSRAASPW
jgi:outer membrane receptor protein involved in Fe transport